MGNTIAIEAAKAIGKKNRNRVHQGPEQASSNTNQEGITRDNNNVIPSDTSAFVEAVPKKKYRFHRKKVYGNVSTDDLID